ncbi:MAG: type II secretion system protein [Actinobacteria bacterium]|nr:type II secretion system protein [Actinomycetota bacterium]
MTRRHAEAGFTWLELVFVVVCVTGLLIVAVVSVNGIRDDTRDGNCRDALRALKTAAEQYHAANDAYPVNKDVLVDSGIVSADDVEGWNVEFAAGAEEPTYVATGDCA